jgi:hypothetical protein
VTILQSVAGEASTRPQSAIGYSAAERRTIDQLVERLVAENKNSGITERDVRTIVRREMKRQAQITAEELEAAVEENTLQLAEALEAISARVSELENRPSIDPTERKKELDNLNFAQQSARSGDFETFSRFMAMYRQVEQQEVLDAQWRMIESQIEAALTNQLAVSASLQLQSIDTWIQFLKEYIVAAPAESQAAPRAWLDRLDAAKRALLKTTPWLSGSTPDMLTEDAGDVVAVRFFTDGRRIASGARDGSISIWSVDRRSRLARIEYPGGRATAFALSPNGRQIVVGTQKGTLAILNASDGSIVRALDQHYAEVTAIAWSKDGRSIVSTSKDNSIRLQDSGTGRTSRMLAPLRDCFLPTSTEPEKVERLTAGASPGSALRAACQIPWGTEAVDIAFTNNGQSVIYNAGTTGILQQILTGRIEGKLGGGSGETAQVSAPPSGQFYITEGGSSGLQFWRPGLNRLLCSANGDGIRDIAVSADARFVGVATEKNVVRIIAADCGTLADLEGHGMPVAALDFAPDGKSVVSGGEDGRLILWRDKSQP